MTKRIRHRKRGTCYACNSKTTSRDHVPPKCFFLAESGSAITQQRTNLITVPSCDKHNLGRSGDDQYLVAVATSYIENNSLAEQVFDSVVLSTIRRRPWMGLTFFHGIRSARLGAEQAGVYHVDKDRFDRTAALVARGIHFHHFGKKATGRARVLTYNMLDVSSPSRHQVNAALLNWRQYSERILASESRYGENQKTFFYQVVEHPEDGRVIVRLVFYEGLVVDVLFTPDSESHRPTPAPPKEPGQAANSGSAVPRRRDLLEMAR